MADLVEVYSVLIYNNKYDDDKSIKGGELYGAILANDRCDSTFFRADGSLSDNYILSDGTLSLTGPHRCNDGDDWFFRLKLYLKKGDDVLELCYGVLKLSPVEYTAYQNKHMTGCVPGKDGYALVNLVTYSSAVQAIVEISLEDDDNSSSSSSTAFYGHVRATNSCQKYRSAYDRKYFQTTMFSTSKHNPRSCEGGIIPLSRRVIAVPYRAMLYIESQLFDFKTDIPMVSDKLSFDAQRNGEEIQKIGCFQVKVTWAEHRHFE